MPVSGEVLEFPFSDRLGSFPDGWPCSKGKKKKNRLSYRNANTISKNIFYLFLKLAVVVLVIVDVIIP